MAALSFKGRHFQHNMILQSVRWYLAYSLSYRDIEELMHERGFSVDHSTINRWVLHYAPQLEAAFRRGEYDRRGRALCRRILCRLEKRVPGLPF